MKYNKRLSQFTLALAVIASGVASAVDPTSVALVSFQTNNGSVPCSSSWYQDRFKTWRMFQFDPMACWNGLKGDAGQYHMFAAQDFSDKAIVAVNFAAPVTTVTVRQVYGRDDYINRQADVEVSFDFGVTWIASSRDAWSAPSYVYVPYFVCQPWSCPQRPTKSWTATAPYPITVVWVKGKKYTPVAGRTWLPDIAVVQGN